MNTEDKIKQANRVFNVAEKSIMKYIASLYDDDITTILNVGCWPFYLILE